MRTPFLQYLYLQKPLTTILIICAASVLPWIGLGDFSTKGEPREAAVAISMLESGNHTLPQTYADEFAYKPPMAHWMMAALSIPSGHVSEFTSRLPSALAYITLIGVTLFFFGQRNTRFQETFIAALLLLTSIEIHRAGTTARVDMLLTTFIVTGLYTLYRWDDCRELKGLPISIPLLLGCAALTKGPVGIVLPLLTFGIYLLALSKYKLPTILKALLYAGTSSLFLPLIWYAAAWKQGGNDFINIVMAENFGRFFHAPVAINYELGHENGIWYNLLTLLAGFMPWTILILLSLPAIKLPHHMTSLKTLPRKALASFRSMEKPKQFSLIALICILVFYSIPSSKRSVYLMPAYPFIAIFLAQYILYATQYAKKATGAFAIILVSIIITTLTLATLVATKVIDPVAIAATYTSRATTLNSIEIIKNAIISPDTLTALITAITLAATVTVLCHMRRKINLKILYSAIFLVFAIHLIIDGIIMRAIHNETSPRPFAERIIKEYPVDKSNVYVMNNPKEYANLYGLNFYMHNTFHNFETERPQSGYLFAAENDAAKITTRYKDTYTFHHISSSDKESGDLKQKIYFYKFVGK
ncbi:MAG: glycosyltransferase family 39 protein [Tannerellaceae bacterium]|jgi:4-amino-4-deoxy-L-arabinose transferase-like glycosyltransferase|nr:glycosyltransferase family 39 protein [Tannerellaceae bacterium]